MNCREAQHRILTERDGALDEPSRAALAGHLADCAGCRRVQDDLTAALSAWRTEVANVTVPDAEREWHAVRRRIRGGETGADRPARSRRSLFTWIALPLGAAAAAALALYVSPSPRFDPAPIAHVDSVEAPGNNASTMVFVDDKSGWLIVWASDATPTGD
ncbi:MAG: zf-HC2 domain-containing protein [Opitutaceae bacterium]|nr:zf-HC2 domain-containing protein [Opitutaceae bacterium]